MKHLSALLRLLFRDFGSAYVPHEMHRSGASLEQIAGHLVTRNRKPNPPAKAFVHAGTESVVVILTEPITERTIEVLTDPRPRQQVGINLALRWARRNKRTLLFS